ncbi:MAG: hypothetical protein ACO38W_10745 [Phycisphaerales bacterium]
MTSSARRSIPRWPSACLPGFALAAAAQAAAAAASPTGSAAAPAAAPAATDSSGIGLDLAVLVVGGTVLTALLVYLIGRAIRGSAGSISPGMRATSRREASTDAWREAGRRHPVPPRESESTDGDDGPSERFG